MIGSSGGPAIDIRRPDRLIDQVEALLGPVAAVMLYGSHARETAGDESDVDILALVEQRPRDVREGALNITAYHRSHLTLLAERGSLFVQHLRQDGKILYDPRGLLKTALDAYRPPRDKHRLAAELHAATEGLLSATPGDVEKHGRGMRALSYYLMRTAIYDRCARSGRPEFDLEIALGVNGLTDLASVFAARRAPFTDERLTEVIDGLGSVFSNAEPRFSSLAAAAVELSGHRPLASDLLSSVLVGDAVPYTALTLPPG